jgi:ribosomal protein L11 methyltransferase
LAAASRIELRLRSAYPDFAEELLFAQGAEAVRQEDAADEPLLEPPPGATPLWQATVTCGYFRPGTDLDAIERAARSLLPDGAALICERRAIEEADWLHAWKQHAQPLSFGNGALWICPSHAAIDTGDAARVLLDPGLAFGTGTHPSTSLCLEWLATHEVRGRRVLDYGCGSGILAIAALKLGAASALAIDIDQQALTATTDNARSNAVDDRLTCASVEQTVDNSVDIVLANILARPLVGLASRLAAAVRGEGHIVLAGILDEQAAEVRAAYEPWFDFDDDLHRDGWACVSGRRRTSG